MFGVWLVFFVLNEVAFNVDDPGCYFNVSYIYTDANTYLVPNSPVEI